MSELDTLVVTFQTQLLDVMETLVKSAMFKVTQLVEDGFLEEMKRKNRELQTLRVKLECAERKLSDNGVKERGTSVDASSDTGNTSEELQDDVLKECGLKRETYSDDRSLRSRRTEEDQTPAALTHTPEPTDVMPAVNDGIGLEDSDMAALLSVEMDAGRTGQTLHHQNLGTDRKCYSAKVLVHRAEQGLEEYFTEGNVSPVTHDRGQLCSSSPKERLLKLDSLGVSVKQETIVDCGGIQCVKKEASQPEILSSCAVKRNRESSFAPKQNTNPRKTTAQEQLKQNSNVGTFDKSRAAMKQLIRPIKKPALSNNTLALSCTYLNIDTLNRIPSTSKATPPATLQRSHTANKFTSAVSRTATQCVSNRSQAHARSLAHPDGHTVHPLRCGHCDKCFPHLSNLKAHLQIHTGERPFCCSLCGRSFTKLSNLKAHRRVHTGERPYCCLACGKRFTQKCNLKRHQRIHVDE